MGFCNECGTKLIQKKDGIDGLVDYCPVCQKFKYPMFNSGISTIIIQDHKILLIKQYGRNDYILVAGYITKGENAKETLIREVKEETDLDVINYEYNDNFYFQRSNTLMHNYISYVEGSIQLTDEVDEAAFFSFHDAYLQIRPKSLAKKFLYLALLKIEVEALFTYENNGISIYDDQERLVARVSENENYVDESLSSLQLKTKLQEEYQKIFLNQKSLL